MTPYLSYLYDDERFGNEKNTVFSREEGLYTNTNTEASKITRIYEYAYNVSMKILKLICGAVFHDPEFEWITKREKPFKSNDAFRGDVYIK